MFRPRRVSFPWIETRVEVNLQRNTVFAHVLVVDESFSSICRIVKDSRSKAVTLQMCRKEEKDCAFRRMSAITLVERIPFIGPGFEQFRAPIPDYFCLLMMSWRKHQDFIQCTPPHLELGYCEAFVYCPLHLGKSWLSQLLCNTNSLFLSSPFHLLRELLNVMSFG